MIKWILITCFCMGFSAWAEDEVKSAVSPAVSPAESEIPLNIATAAKVAEGPSTSNRLILTGFILIGIISTTYFLVRKYKLSNGINQSNKQIKVISQHYLGPKKSLAIIHVAGESVLIGVTDSNISMIKSLSLIDDEIPAQVPKTFSQTLEAPTPTESASPVAELEEEFSFSGVKDSVSKKLKSMRSFS